MDRRWSRTLAVLLMLCAILGGGDEYIWPSAMGPRVAEPALLMIDPYPWSAPLEEVRLKKN